MNLGTFGFVSYVVLINKLVTCNSHLNTEKSLPELINTLKSTQTLVKDFEELYKLTKDEVVKYKDLIKDLPRNIGHTPNRFTQLSEPADPSKIRESLYVTQLRRGTPQSKVLIDIKENVDDVVKNTSNIASLTEEPEADYFEEELHRMTMEEIKNRKIESLADQLKAMESEIQRLIAPKESTKSHTPKIEKPENEPVASLMEDIYKQCSEPSCFDRDPSTRTNAQYPPDRTELGNAAWLFLHTISSRFPEKPDEDSRLKTLGFIYSFASLYPCAVCREGLVPIMKRLPPLVRDRRSLVLWASKLHNMVNKDIGKPEEHYTYEQLLEKYP